MHVECYWYDEYDTLHLPIPVLYEMIFLLQYIRSMIRIMKNLSLQ